MASLRLLHTECSPNWGGEEASILRLSLAQQALGHEVWVAAQPGSALLARARESGLPTLAVPMPSALAPRSTLALGRLVRGRGIDLIHCHGAHDNWLCLPLMPLAPIVRWRHVSSPVPSRLSRSFIYRHGSRRLITVGRATRQALIEVNGVDPAKVESLPAGVDLAAFRPGVDGSPLRSAWGCGEGCVLFGLVAMLRPEKGHRPFLEAAALLRERLPNARFVMVGGEANLRREELSRVTFELGLGERVIFEGHRDDIPQVMAALDVLVLPSTGVEGLPQVIQQAMAAGRPVIATPVGSVADLVVPEETGLLVPVRDPVALAGAMERLANDRALRERLGEAGRRFAEQHLSFERVLARVEQIQTELLAGRGR